LNAAKNVMQNTKNKVFFNMSVLLFPDQYLKRDFFDRLNGLLYWRLGRKKTENGNLPKFRTSSKKRSASQPSGARFIGRTHQTQTFLIDNEYQTPLKQILLTTISLAIN
jgi:hypothetical protein